MLVLAVLIYCDASNRQKLQPSRKE
ncbi:hypothetical protein NGA_0470700 [Nannochloropsis gaditana CCMP526]|nr:hypothetical protein NGA_0470700 [Nannochloropsis gaditana CCMP526]EKU22714.1 hypothetical protein NGA_0470700 [Nannochloropsis gaditana CCMP526]|eukprot:XP_005853647.1 hypothetical protein NGA_0470700 [Nannochloropsis gaditana CCMP526]